MLGWYDPELRDLAWYDPELVVAGWYDEELINQASSGVPAVSGVAVASQDGQTSTGLGSLAFYVSAAAGQDGQVSVALGGLGVGGIAAGSQDNASGASVAALALLGLAAGHQDDQTSAAEGVSVGGVAVSVGVSRSGRRRRRVDGQVDFYPKYKPEPVVIVKPKPVLPAEPPVYVVAVAAGAQRKPTGSGAGAVAMGGSLSVRQLRQVSVAHAALRMDGQSVSKAEQLAVEMRERARYEEELVIELLLMAA